MVQLRCDITWMIAHEKSALMRSRCIGDAADDVIVEVLDRGVKREAAAGNHPELDTGLSKRVHDARAVDVVRRVENEREAEPRARAVFTLNDEPRIILEQRHERGRVSPTG